MWLRRRLLWYFGIVIGFSVLTIVSLVIAAFATDTGLISLLTLGLTVLMTVPYCWAFVRVKRRPIARDAGLRLVTWLMVANGVIALAIGPFSVSAGVNRAADLRIAELRERALTEGFDAPAEAEDVAVVDAPGARIVATEDNGESIAERIARLESREFRHRLAARGVLLNNSIASIFLAHFFACLFLPWTPRESLRPMVPLLAVNAIICLWYIRVLPVGVVWSIVLSPLIVLPGVLICWWRHSRFKDRFHIRMIKGRYGEIRRELDTARTIHDGLFPRPLREGPVRLDFVYAPMRSIGGDYLYARLSERTGALNMIVIDVTGHGISAALTVNRLHGEIERQLGEDPDVSPGRMLRGLNAYLHHTVASHSVYATALCVRVEPHEGTLRWASAGHPPAFLRAVDGTIERIESTTLVLGASKGDDFDPCEQHTRFGPGDVLIAYTDGAIECRDENGKMLGVAGFERLIASINPTRHEGSSAPAPADGGWCSSVMRIVEGRRNGAAQDDTLIVEVSRAL